MNHRRHLLATPRSILGVVLGAVLGATAALALPAPASAATDVHRDPAQDVLRIEDESPDTPRVPGQRTADIVRIASAHGRTVVAVTLTLRDLPAADFDYDVRFKTPGAGFFELSFLKHDAGDTPQFDLWRVGEEWVEVSCPGKTRRVDHAAGTIRLVVPRACLDRPRWVRTGAGANVLAGHDAGFVDDARRKAAYDVSRLALGPRLARG